MSCRPDLAARDENSRDRGRAEAVFGTDPRKTERVACPMARSDQKVSSKRRTEMGIEKLGAERGAAERSWG